MSKIKTYEVTGEYRNDQGFVKQEGRISQFSNGKLLGIIQGIEGKKSIQNLVLGFKGNKKIYLIETEIGGDESTPLIMILNEVTYESGTLFTKYDGKCLQIRTFEGGLFDIKQKIESSKGMLEIADSIERIRLENNYNENRTAIWSKASGVI